MKTLFCDNCGAENKENATSCWSCKKVLTRAAQDSEESASSANTLLHGHYRVVAQLGAGGFGAVYKAYDTHLHNRVVAVKQIHTRGMTAEEVAEAAASFQQEVQLLTSLRHPGLPVIFEEFEHEGSHYLVMDFIEGETLEDYVAHKGGKLPLDEVLDIAHQLCDILDYLHTRKPAVIFRDLKPSNVMRTDQGHLYLIDFGIARYFKPGQLKDTIAFGSPGYAAPEQYGRAQTTPCADVYSLGALLHALLTGEDPSLNPFHFSPLPHSKQGEMHTLDTLIQRMVAMDEGRRPASIKEVKRELRGIQQNMQRPPLGQMPAGKQRKQQPARGRKKSSSPRKSTRRRLLAGLLITGGLVIGGSTLFALVEKKSAADKVASSEVDLNIVYWSPDKKYVAFCWSDGKISMLEVSSQKVLYSFNFFQKSDASDAVNAQVCWSPDSKRLAFFYYDQPVQIWDLQLRKVVLTYPGDADLPFSSGLSPSATGVAWSPDGRFIAWTGSEVDVWEATGADNVASLSVAKDNFPQVLSWASDSQHLAVALLGDGSASNVTNVQVFDVLKQQQTGIFTFPGTGDVLVSCAPVGNGLAVYKDPNLYLVSTADTTKMTTIKNIVNNVTYAEVNDLAWSSDGKFLALAATSGFWIYSIEAGRLFSYDSGTYVALTWLAQGKIALVSQTGQIVVMPILQATPAGK